MRIGVNARILLEGKLEGVGLFTHEVMRRVVARMSGDDFIFFFDRTPSETFLYNDRVRGVILPPQARHPYLWYWWFEHSLPSALKRYEVDLFISPDGYTTLRSDVPSVVCIHDLAFHHYRKHLPFLVQRYLNHYTPKFIEKATQVVTVSEFTKRDMVKTYGTDPSRISVVGNGSDSAVGRIPAEQVQLVRSHYTGKAPYFIYIGSIHPRKNVERLLLAFDQFKSAYESDIKLVIAGRWAWKTRRVEKVYRKMRYRDAVIPIGHVERGELGQLLGASIGLVYPSLFEGFGIPVLEAMYAEVPVITSASSSMAEVAGDAACYVDPTSVEEIAGAMEKISKNYSYGRELVEKGKTQRLKYSWDIAADKMIAVLEGIKKRHS